MSPDSQGPAPDQAAIKAAVDASGVLESPAPQPASPGLIDSVPGVVRAEDAPPAAPPIIDSMPGQEAAAPVVGPSTDRVPVPMTPELRAKLDAAPAQAAMADALVDSVVRSAQDAGSPIVGAPATGELITGVPDHLKTEASQAPESPSST